MKNSHNIQDIGCYKKHLPFLSQNGLFQWVLLILDKFFQNEIKYEKFVKHWIYYVCKNSSLENFICKSCVQKKSNEKCQENGHFDVWFLENSKKI